MDQVATVALPCINPIEKFVGLPMPVPRLSGVRLLAREVRRADAVLVHDALYFTSIFAALFAKRFGKRVILIQHIAAVPFSSATLRLLMWLANLVVTRPMLRAADERVFISDTVRHDLLGTPARQSYSLLFNGVDSSLFYPPKRRRLRRLPRQILFVGRYVEKKGLTVIRELASLRPDLSFVLVGSGPIRPADWKLSNVQDVGQQSPKTLSELYRSTDLLLLPSVGEGYPLVIQEAMACGLPVVCGEPSNRADPDAAQWLRGVRVDLTDPKGSAQRCSEAITQRSSTGKDRIEMADYASSRYNWQKMAQSILHLARPD